jgi:hypothetical protein
MAFMGSASLIMMLPLWAIKKWFPEAENNFYKKGMQALVQQWRNCVQINGEYVGK